MRTKSFLSVNRYLSAELVETNQGESVLTNPVSRLIICRYHLSRPRRVLPGQHIHYSAWCDDIYEPRATLGSHIAIPILRDGPSPYTIPDDMRLSLFTWTQCYAADRTLSDLLRSSECIDTKLFDPALWPDLIFEGLDKPSIDIQDRQVWQDCIETRRGFGKVVAITAYISIRESTFIGLPADL